MGETVLVVDDHAGFGASVRELLEAEGFEVVGEARDAGSGIEAVRALRPDVVLLDVQLPDFDGVQAVALTLQQPAGMCPEPAWSSTMRALAPIRP